MRLTSRRVLVIAVPAIVGLFASAYAWIAAVYHDAYALWNIGDVVVYHLARTGDWPRSWEDLRIDFAEGFGDADGERMAHLRGRIEIEFYADPARLRSYPAWHDALAPPFRVIRTKSGRTAHFNEPNEMVWAYLNGRGRPATLPATTVPMSR